MIKFIYKRLDLILVLLLANIILILGYIEQGPIIPDRTHFLVAYSNLYIDSPSFVNSLYGLISTLVLELTSIIYIYPGIWNTIGLTVYLFSFNFLVFIGFNIVKVKKSIVINIFVPTFFLTLFILLQSEVVQNIFGSHILPKDFMVVNFSQRTTFFIFYTAFLYAIVTSRNVLSSLFVLFAINSHPSAGSLLFLFFLSYLTYCFVTKKITKKNFWFSIILPTIGLIPLLVKYLYVINIANITTLVDSRDYILSMYINELDDFSILHNFIQSATIHGWTLPFILLAYVIPSFLNFATKEKFINCSTVFGRFEVMALLPILLFILFFYIELLFSIATGPILKSLPIEPVIEFMISSQLGHRVLQFSFIPVIFLWLILIRKFFLGKSIYKEYTLYFSSVVLFGSIMINSIKDLDFNTTLNKYKVISDWSYSIANGRDEYYRFFQDRSISLDGIRNVDECITPIYANTSNISARKNASDILFERSKELTFDTKF